MAIRPLKQPSAFADPALTQASGAKLPVTWATLEHGEYPRFLASLRGFGCPEDVIRDMVVAEIFCHAAERDTTGSGPWNALLSCWPHRAQALTIVAQSNRILGRRVLALDGTSPDDPDAVAAEAEVDFIARMNALRIRMGGTEPSPADKAAQRQIEEDRHAALQRVYTPLQLEHYEFESSGELTALQRDFAALAPSEEESVVLARLHRLEKGPSPGDLAQLKELLGAARFAAYHEILHGDRTVNRAGNNSPEQFFAKFPKSCSGG